MRTAGRVLSALWGVGVVLVGLVAFAGSANAADSLVPYTDPNAVGSIGLCDQQGHQISSGSVTAKPFAWRAVSTEPALAPYNNAGRTATLVVYQPQQDLPAGDWSGMQLTSSSSYTNPASPMAAATAADQSLADVIAQYPPKWDGLLQLRMYLSTANEQADNVYPDLNIQVTGNTWRAVGGSAVDCAAGTAESIETALLPAETTTTTTPRPVTTTVPVGTTAPTPVSDPAAVNSPSRSKDGSAALASGTAPAAAPAKTSALPVALIVLLGVLLVLAAVVATLLWRRRSSVQPTFDSSTDHH